MPWNDCFNRFQSFKELWPFLVANYGKKVAYFIDEQGYSYEKIDQDIQDYRKKFFGQSIVRINGLEPNWLTQAIAAWSENQLVIFFNPEWKKTDHLRYQLTMSQPKDIDWHRHPHILILTSGSTGVPKSVIRNTDFALFEAHAYLKDVLLPNHYDKSVCLIKPWFGAITKHCLGMLLAGIPQHFSITAKDDISTYTLIYGTPSLITHHPSIVQQTWQTISLTGENINAHHIETFKKCLASNGFLLDSYGSTESGVIARRKIAYHDLNTLLGKGFKGEVLPGKEVIIDKNAGISVRGQHFEKISIGDHGCILDQQLELMGRISHQRKIRGIWYDASPLMKLLSSHPDILHSELCAEQTADGQLIVIASGKSHLIVHELYDWLFEHLNCLALIPQIILSDEPPSLGVTGKQLLRIDPKKKSNFLNHHITLMSEALVNNSQTRMVYKDESFENQGFDSIDLANLMIDIEKKTGKNFPGRTLLKTDTPRIMLELLNQDFIPSPLRTISKLKENNIQVIFIGSGMLGARHEVSKIANLKYTDIIACQKKPFHFSELAIQIIEKDWEFFSRKPSVYLAGYSINALLAIEMAYQLEKRGIYPQGIFLLDPPNLKRAQYLKRKKIFLSMRSKILKIFKCAPERYYYELRKLAIVKQEKRAIKCPSLSLYTSANFSENIWLAPANWHQSLKIDFLDHLELVNTSAGIDSWLSIMMQEIHHRFNTDAVMRETAVIRL
jgi:acyl carrier protein